MKQEFWFEHTRRISEAVIDEMVDAVLVRWSMTRLLRCKKCGRAWGAATVRKLVVGSGIGHRMCSGGYQQIRAQNLS